MSRRGLASGAVAMPIQLATVLGPQATIVRHAGYGHEQWRRSPCVAATESAFLVDPTAWGAPPGAACAN